jgi:hypothetical protein
VAREAGNRWSPEDVATLNRLWDELASDETMAATLGRSVRAVAIKRCRLGLTSSECQRATAASELTSDEMIAELQARGFVFALSEPAKPPRRRAGDRIPSDTRGDGL